MPSNPSTDKIARHQKVLLLITRLDRGGSAELTMQLASGLVRNGFKVTLISGKTIEPAFDPADYAERNRFRLVFINSLLRSLNPVLDFIALVQVYRAIQKYRPDVLHTNTSKAGFIGRLAGRLARVKVIVHSTHGHIFYGYYSRLFSRFFAILEKFAAHCCDKILNLTKRGMNDHIRERIAPPDKFIVSSCGIKLNRFYQNTKKSRKSDDIIVCWAGRIVPIKNLQMLIQAAALLKNEKPQIRFLIAGDGELMEECKKLAADLNLDSVTFLGYRQDLAEIFSECDIFVLTSRNEGFGRVLIEAMTSGLPIIATRVGGVPEIVSDGINGILVPSDDPTALAGAILQLSRNEEKRQAISQVNRKIAEFYTIDNYVNRVIGIYQDLSKLNKG